MDWMPAESWRWPGATPPLSFNGSEPRHQIADKVSLWRIKKPITTALAQTCQLLRCTFPSAIGG